MVNYFSIRFFKYRNIGTVESPILPIVAFLINSRVDSFNSASLQYNTILALYGIAATLTVAMAVQGITLNGELEKYANTSSYISTKKGSKKKSGNNPPKGSSHTLLRNRRRIQRIRNASTTSSTIGALIPYVLYNVTLLTVVSESSVPERTQDGDGTSWEIFTQAFKGIAGTSIQPKYLLFFLASILMVVHVILGNMYGLNPAAQRAVDITEQQEHLAWRTFVKRRTKYRKKWNRCLKHITASSKAWALLWDSLMFFVFLNIAMSISSIIYGLSPGAELSNLAFFIGVLSVLLSTYLALPDRECVAGVKPPR